MPGHPYRKWQSKLSIEQGQEKSQDSLLSLFLRSPPSGDRETFLSLESRPSKNTQAGSADPVSPHAANSAQIPTDSEQSLFKHPLHLYNIPATTDWMISVQQLQKAL